MHICVTVRRYRTCSYCRDLKTLLFLNWFISSGLIEDEEGQMYIEPYPTKVCLDCHDLRKTLENAKIDSLSLCFRGKEHIRYIKQKMESDSLSLCFRGKEHIRYIKQKMESGKGFHVVS